MKRLLSVLLLVFAFSRIGFAADVEIDYFEYADDATAQAAYVSSDTIPATLLLWSKMGAAGEITSPEVGEAGAITGGSYAACKFDNGFQVDANSEYIKFDNSDLLITKGCIEFWYKPFYDVDYASLAHIVAIKNAPTELHCRFDPNSNKLDFYIAGSGGTSRSDWTIDWSVNDLVHIACVYDKDAGFDGAKTTALYVNGVEKASGTTAFATLNWGTADLNVGNRSDNDRQANGIIDNIKIWDYAKIDFSDRNIEDSYNLQSYSESTIKQQGTYSLKAIAAQTDSLNDTLTRTVSPTIDLSGKDDWIFYIYASRTGSNIKVGIHDSGGTTTESTPNVTPAGAWQKVTVDVSGVSDANKDAIDSIVITPVNADAANTFYVDNMYGTIVAVDHPTTSQLLLGGIWFKDGKLQYSDFTRFKRGTE